MCAPIDREEMVQVAVLFAEPEVRVTELEQVRGIVPSKKVTDPVGMASPVTPVTVAVKVNVVPKATEAVPVVSAVAIVGVAAVMAWDRAGVEGPAAP